MAARPSLKHRKWISTSTFLATKPITKTCVLALLLVAASVVAALDCPDDTWLSYDNSCYKLVNELYGRNYSEAWAHCREMYNNSGLLWIDSVEEKEWVKRFNWSLKNQRDSNKCRDCNRLLDAAWVSLFREPDPPHEIYWDPGNGPVVKDTLLGFRDWYFGHPLPPDREVFQMAITEVNEVLGNLYRSNTGNEITWHICKIKDPVTTTMDSTTTEVTTIEETTSGQVTSESTSQEFTTRQTTPETTTPEPTTPEPTTPEPTTPKPTSPKPTSPEPTSPQPTTPEPTTPKPTSPEPTTPEPTTPKPTSPEPTSLQPTTSEPTTPEPTTSKQTTPEPTTREPTTPELTTKPTTPGPTTSQPTTFDSKTPWLTTTVESTTVDSTSGTSEKITDDTGTTEGESTALTSTTAEIFTTYETETESETASQETTSSIIQLNGTSSTITKVEHTMTPAVTTSRPSTPDDNWFLSLLSAWIIASIVTASAVLLVVLAVAVQLRFPGVSREIFRKRQGKVAPAPETRQGHAEAATGSAENASHLTVIEVIPME